VAEQRSAGGARARAGAGAGGAGPAGQEARRCWPAQQRVAQGPRCAGRAAHVGPGGALVRTWRARGGCSARAALAAGALARGPEARRLGTRGGQAAGGAPEEMLRSRVQARSADAQWPSGDAHSFSSILRLELGSSRDLEFS
jgi:hypothetical protein